MQISSLICGIAFIILAILDAVGVQFTLQKKYRGLPATRKWQKRQAVLEAVFGVVAIVLFILKAQDIIVTIIVAILMLILVFFRLNGKAFNKTIQK